MSEWYEIEVEDTPLWSNAIGVIVGCIVGILVSRMLNVIYQNNTQ
jgi:uncharacterized membrane-anchored protein YhcB (DUF1043 family)